MWLFGKGYVIIQIEGLALSAFLHQLDKQGIRVTDIRYLDSTTVRAALLKNDVPKLIPIRRRFRTKVRIVSRHGVPFLWRSIWQRPILVIGGLLMLLLMKAGSERIWSIQTIGATETQRQALPVLLEENGIVVGCRPKGDILISASDDLTARLPDAAWVELDRNGVYLTVTVSPFMPQTESKAKDGPAHIVAKKDGVILRIHVKRGESACRVGDIVRSGDVLIGGAIDFGEDRTPFTVCAEGTVTAAVVYRAECPLPEVLTEYRLTGETEQVTAVSIGTVQFMKKAGSFPHGYTEWEEPVRVSDLGIPVSIQYGTNYAFAETQVVLTRERAEQLARKQAQQEALDSVPKDASIISIHSFVQTMQGIDSVVCIVTAEEEIGIAKEF